MSHESSVPLYITTNPANTPASASQSDLKLRSVGLNLLVELSTPSAFMSLAGQQRKTMTVMAHFDTGCTISTIDSRIAAHLGLIQIGISQSHTAGGLVPTKMFSADIVFLNSQLKPFLNHQISALNLSSYNFQDSLNKPDNTNNYGMLIGRDLMSKWSIYWHGPTSNAFIAD